MSQSPDVVYKGMRDWSQGVFLIAQRTAGIKVQLHGTENIPPIPCIYVARHESELDTMMAYHLIGTQGLRRVVYVMKEELFKVPLYGRLAHYVGMISHKRRAGKEENLEMLRMIRASLEQGISVCFFPETARMVPGILGDLRPALLLYSLYKDQWVPIVPMNTNAGRIFPRSRLGKKPGVAEYQVGQPLKFGLSRTAFLAKLTEVLEQEPISDKKRRPQERKKVQS